MAIAGCLRPGLRLGLTKSTRLRKNHSGAWNIEDTVGFLQVDAGVVRMPQAARWVGSPSIKGKSESVRMALLTFSLLGLQYVFSSTTANAISQVTDILLF